MAPIREDCLDCLLDQQRRQKVLAREQLELYAKLNVPPEPIKPKKTWLKQG
ncbi:MAG: hypothetical protein ACPL5F_02820 [Moorellaceae bacterium]